MRQALEMALEALSKVGYVPDAVNPHPIFVAITAIKEALAQPEQEPVAKKMTAHRAVYFMERFKHDEKLLGPNEQAALDFVISMLEAQPPQRTWVGLTEQEAAECWSTSTVRTWQAIEAKLKDKNL